MCRINKLYKEIKFYFRSRQAERKIESLFRL